MTATAKPPGAGSPDPIGADDVPSLRQRLLVPTLVLSGSLMAVVSSLGAPLIPTLARADGVSLSTGEWILTITLLTGALATPVMGRLADGPRQRAVILVALGAVVVGCVLAAVSNGFTVLIIGRALQGRGPRAPAGGDGHRPPEPALGCRPADHRHPVGHHRHRGRSGLSGDRADRPGSSDFRAAYWFGAITVTGALVSAAVVLPPRSAGPPGASTSSVPACSAWRSSGSRWC